MIILVVKGVLLGGRYLFLVVSISHSFLPELFQYYIYNTINTSKNNQKQKQDYNSNNKYTDLTTSEQ